MAEKTDFGSSWCTRITGFLLASCVWNLSEHPFAPAPPWQTSHGHGFTSPLLPVSAFVGMLSRCGFSGVSVCPGLPRCALARCRRAQTFDYKGVAVMNLWALCWRSAGGWNLEDCQFFMGSRSITCWSLIGKYSLWLVPCFLWDCYTIEPLTLPSQFITE